MDLNKFLTEFDNDKCADCHASTILGFSTDWKVFVCKECTETHVRLGGGWRSLASLKVALVKELNMLIDFGRGNKHVNAELEAELPVWFRRPWPGIRCPTFIREYFVHYKYIAKSFSPQSAANGLQISFKNPVKIGTLLKKLRDSASFVPRYFEINSIEGTLKYYIKQTDSEPKEAINLERCNMNFIDSTQFNMPLYTTLVQFVQGNSTRHIFVRSEDPREILDWYNTLRLCKYTRLLLHFSGSGLDKNKHEILSYLTTDLDKVGWLLKAGPDAGYAFRKRWVIIVRRRLLYTNDPQSAFAKGEIFIGSLDNGYSVCAEAPFAWKKCPTEYPFTINTPERAFVFCASSATERDEWVSLILELVRQPTTLYEEKEAALVCNSR